MMVESETSETTISNLTLCYNVSRGPVVTIQCDYPFFYHIENLLYRTFFGCIFHLIEVLLLGALWFCNFWIQRDFTEAFLTSIAFPLSLSTVMKIATFTWELLFPRQIQKAWLIYAAFGVSITAAQMTLVQGLPFFLFMAVKVGTSRQHNYGICTWIPYLLNMLIAFSVSGVFNIFYEKTYAAPSLIAILALIFISVVFQLTFIGTGCMTFLCCTKLKNSMNMLDPVIYDARSRLGWAILFTFVAPLFFYPCIYCFISLSFFLDVTDSYEMLGNEMARRVWSFFFAPSLLILTFACLPSYRDVLLCGCRKRQFTKTGQNTMKIVETHVTPVISIKNQKSEEPIFVSSATKKKGYPVQLGGEQFKIDQDNN